MLLSHIWLRKYLGKVRTFQAATGKYLGYKKILSTENQLLLQDKVSKF